MNEVETDNLYTALGKLQEENYKLRRRQVNRTLHLILSFTLGAVVGVTFAATKVFADDFQLPEIGDFEIPELEIYLTAEDMQSLNAPELRYKLINCDYNVPDLLARNYPFPVQSMCLGYQALSVFALQERARAAGLEQENKSFKKRIKKLRRNCGR